MNNNRGGANPDVAPASPCISVCTLDSDDICMGCYRSAEEITDWFMASAEQKQKILDNAIARRKKDGPLQLL